MPSQGGPVTANAGNRGSSSPASPPRLTRRERAAQAVEGRKPEVATSRMVTEFERRYGANLFTRWLNNKDVVLRESLHGENFFTRWRRAQTTDLVYKFRSWNRLRSPYRYIRCFTPLGFLKSDIVRRMVFPDLTFLATTSTTLCIYNSVIAEPGWVLSLPIEPFTITSMAVGLLVTFRTQTSYGRYNEARLLWNVTASRSRELCSRILARIPCSPTSESTLISRQRIHGAKLAQTFPHALKYHVTVDGDNADLRAVISTTTPSQLIRSKKAECFQDELELIWDLDDPEEGAIVQRLIQANVHNWPMQVCQELSYLIGKAYTAPNPGGLGHPNSEGMDRMVLDLQQVTADCEQLIQTPIYTPYTVFSGRILYIWVHSVAFAMYPLIGPVVTPAISLFTGFLLLGIDDIGSRTEQPFDILPLWQYVANIDKDCVQLLKNSAILDKELMKQERGSGAA